MSRLLTIPSGRRAKWVVFVVFLLVSIPIAALSGKFEQAQKNESSSFLPGKAESIKALKAIERYPGGELAPAVIVYERRGGLTGADKQRISQTVGKLNESRPKLVLEAQQPVFSRNGAAAIIMQPVQPGDGQSELFQTAAQHIRDTAGTWVRQPDGEDHGRGRLLARRDQGLREHQRHAVAARLGGGHVLLIIIYRSPSLLGDPVLHGPARRVRRARLRL